MAVQNDLGDPAKTAPALDRNLNKQRIPGTIHRAQQASIGYVADLADAVANSWKSFRAHTSESQSVLDGTLISGSVEAAATFLEGVAKATRGGYSRFQTAAPLGTTAPADLDYAKLARMVAAELKAGGVK